MSTPPAVDALGSSGPSILSRPRQVTIAAVTAIVMSTATAALAVFGIFAGFTVSYGELPQSIRDDFESADPPVTPEQFHDAMRVIGYSSMVAIALCAVGVVLAVLVLRGNNKARTGLIVISVLVAAMALLRIGALVPVVWLITGVLVASLLLSKSAKAWFLGDRT